jgi:hypothetical protein
MAKARASHATSRQRRPTSVRAPRNAADTFLFICWSGPRSLTLAEHLGAFLSQVIPGLTKRIFFSPHIEKGARWFEEVLRHLDAAQVGIICLTPESLAAPWLHFEAGALLKGMHKGPAPADADETAEDATQERIFTYLHGVTPASLSGPLSQYQSTTSTRADTRSLVRALAKRVDRNSHAYRHLFDDHWPAFERELGRLHISMPQLVPEFEAWFRRKTFEEPLPQCTDQDWLGRYEGARQTHERLSAQIASVRSACPRYQVDLYARLLSLLDAYAMDIRALLIGTADFALADSGELSIPRGVLKACENRRNEIKEVVSRLLDPMAVPHTDEAARFWLSDSPDVRKMMVHRCEYPLIASSNGGQSDVDIPPASESPKLLESLWDLDRILGYLLLEHGRHRVPVAEVTLSHAVSLEIDRCRASHDGSMMPLYYACRALKAALRRSGGKASRSTATIVRPLFDEMRQLIDRSRPGPDGEPRLDRGGELRRLMGEIDGLLPGAGSRTGRVSRASVLRAEHRRRRSRLSGNA